MKFIGHLAISPITILLYPIFGVNTLIIFLASMAIDLDHIYLVIKERAFSYKKIKFLSDNLHLMYKKNPKNAFKDIFYLFHTVELNILILILGYLFPALIYISLGFIFHIICDIIHHKINNLPILRWLFFIESMRVKNGS